MFIKIPTGFPDTNIQTAYGVGAFFAALFGPIAGFLIAFIGHALSDAVQYGSPWWSWVIASGLSCFLIGLCYPKMKVEEGIFGVKDVVRFNVYQIIANVIASTASRQTTCLRRVWSPWSPMQSQQVWSAVYCFWFTARHVRKKEAFLRKTKFYAKHFLEKYLQISVFAI